MDVLLHWSHSTHFAISLWTSSVGSSPLFFGNQWTHFWSSSSSEFIILLLYMNKCTNFWEWILPNVWKHRCTCVVKAFSAADTTASIAGRPNDNHHLTRFFSDIPAKRSEWSVGSTVQGGVRSVLLLRFQIWCSLCLGLSSNNFFT